MGRYIDADKIDWRLIIPTNVTIAEENMIHNAKKLVERQPTADVIEVVRCKDCKHNHEHETPMGNKFHICNINKLAFTQYADFYCAYGERK